MCLRQIGQPSPTAVQQLMVVLLSEMGQQWHNPEPGQNRQGVHNGRETVQRVTIGVPRTQFRKREDDRAKIAWRDLNPPPVSMPQGQWGGISRQAPSSPARTDSTNCWVERSAGIGASLIRKSPTPSRHKRP